MELDEIPYDEIRAGAEFLFYGMILLMLPMVVSCYMNGIRRLHDMNKSGWLILVMFILVINIIFNWYLILRKGTLGSNRYGSDPLEGR